MEGMWLGRDLGVGRMVAGQVLMGFFRECWRVKTVLSPRMTPHAYTAASWVFQAEERCVPGRMCSDQWRGLISVM